MYKYKKQCESVVGLDKPQYVAQHGTVFLKDCTSSFYGGGATPSVWNDVDYLVGTAESIGRLQSSEKIKRSGK